MTVYIEPNFPAIFVENQPELRQFDKDMVTVLGDWNETIKVILDKGISFTDNVDVSLHSVVSDGTPGTEFSLTHSLGKTPGGYIVYGQTAAGSIYDGATANNKTTIYFKSDVATVTFRVMIF